MTVTDKLLRLHQVDRQLRGLRNRINLAERYLAQQERLLKEVQQRRETVSSQVRQLKASVANDENEIASFDERVEKLRQQLNSASTSKQYSTFLSEINTLKEQKGVVEERMLEAMGQLEELGDALKDIEGDVQERNGIRDVAAAELQRRKTEASDRLSELEVERKEAAKDVPAHALAVFDEIAARIDPDDDVMAPLEEHSRRSLDYSCGGCQTIVPVELVSRLLGRGDLTLCVSCGSILYMEKELKESMASSSKKGRAEA